MSELIIIDKVNALVQINEQKALLIENEEIKNSFSKVDYRVAVAGTKKPINSLSDDEIIRSVSSFLNLQILSLGIRNFSDSQKSIVSTMMVKDLKNYFGTMTIEDLGLSFDLLPVGVLDEFLPINKHGQPDRECYQDFNRNFYMKVLNAYKAHKSKVWSQVCKVSIEDRKSLTEAEKQENRDFLVRDIKEKFEKFIKDGKRPDFLVPHLVIDFFKENGFVSDIKISQEDKKAAFVNLMGRNFKSEWDKRKINSGDPDGKIQIASERFAMFREIDRIFSEMKETGISIDDILDN